MTLPIIADVIRVSVFGDVEGGVRWSNTFHIKKASGDAFLDAITDAETEVSKLYQASAYGAGNVGWAGTAADGSHADSIIFTPLDGTSPSVSFSIAITGTGTQSPIPAQNAISITQGTAKRGRSYRGRVFWASTAAENMDTHGHVASATATAITSCWNSFNTALQAKTHPTHMVVASYLHATSEAVVGFTTRTVLAHQSKRRGRGA